MWVHKEKEQATEKKKTWTGNQDPAGLESLLSLQTKISSMFSILSNPNDTSCLAQVVLCTQHMLQQQCSNLDSGAYIPN